MLGMEECQKRINKMVEQAKYEANVPLQKPLNALVSVNVGIVAHAGAITWLQFESWCLTEYSKFILFHYEWSDSMYFPCYITQCPK
jgi:hypothetical protein